MENWPEFRPAPLLRRLIEGEVDFVVVGGVAMILSGSARNTNDLDICYATDSGNLERLGGVLVELGATLRGVPEEVPFVPDARTLRRTVILTLDSPDGRLDLLESMKRAAGRPKDSSTLRRSQSSGVVAATATTDPLPEPAGRAAGGNARRRLRPARPGRPG